MPTPMLMQDLASAIDDEVLNDVTLVSSDDEHIPASRYILAVRSPVFRKMLFGEFRENGCEEIQLQFPGATIRSLVHYCFTDELIGLDDEETNNLAEGVNPTYSGDGFELWNLMKASHYFGMYQLECKIRAPLSIVIARNPTINILVACDAIIDGDESDPLFEDTQVNFQMQFRTFVTDELLEGVDESNISKVISRRTSSCDVEHFVRRLDHWASKSTARRRAAKRIVKTLNLALIEPTILDELMKKNGSLISRSTAFKAFRQHALHYSTELQRVRDRASKKRKRGTYGLHTSDSDTESPSHSDYQSSSSSDSESESIATEGEPENPIAVGF